MALYFLDHLQRYDQSPRQLLDANTEHRRSSNLAHKLLIATVVFPFVGLTTALFIYLAFGINVWIASVLAGLAISARFCQTLWPDGGSDGAAQEKEAEAKTVSQSAAEAKAAGLTSPIIPTLKYQDAAAAIEFLCSAFGFERHLVVPGEGDVIEHAQLTLDGGMIMLGSARDTEFDTHQKPPQAVGGAVTQSPYIIVEDVDAHHAKAVAAGAEIVMPPEDQDYGGRFYSCRDPEGHLWNFGSYDPWAEPTG